MCVNHSCSIYQKSIKQPDGWCLSHTNTTSLSHTHPHSIDVTQYKTISVTVFLYSGCLWILWSLVWGLLQVNSLSRDETEAMNNLQLSQFHFILKSYLFARFCPHSVTLLIEILPLFLTLFVNTHKLPHTQTHSHTHKWSWAGVWLKCKAWFT